MKWIGKIVGALLGLMVGHPWAILLGIGLGHLYDIGWYAKWLGISAGGGSAQGRVQEVFFNCSFLVMGHVAKCDGRVSENEIRIAEHVMDEMNLSVPMKKEAIRLFNEGKQAGFDLDRTLKQLRSVCWASPSLLRIFIEIQIKMAHADGRNISPAKQQTLEYICRHLGVIGFRFADFEQNYRAEQDYQRYQYNSAPGNTTAPLQDAYRVLGVAATASDAEIKKAYRRLMSQHHPDKLMSKGLPPGMIKVATEKTQQIKKAYEQICQARKRSSTHV